MFELNKNYQMLKIASDYNMFFLVTLTSLANCLALFLLCSEKKGTGNTLRFKGVCFLNAGNPRYRET